MRPFARALGSFGAALLSGAFLLAAIFGPAVLIPVLAG